MTRQPVVVVLKSIATPPRREQLPADRHDYNPKQRPNPLAVAQFWLGSRFEERTAGYFLDGTPADLTRLMRETNIVLKANGHEPIATNPRWLP